MILLTGGTGFIGSNLLQTLNNCGQTDIVIVDNFENGRKLLNIAKCKYVDLIEVDDFYKNVDYYFKKYSYDVVFHQGADSSTSNWNGNDVLYKNFYCSKLLADRCSDNQIPFVFASSASVYGQASSFCESNSLVQPKNPYAISKLAVEKYCEYLFKKNPEFRFYCLRYFNAYGPFEFHKVGMSSPICKFYTDIMKLNKCFVFDTFRNIKPSEMRRDFIHVSDICEVVNWFSQHLPSSGIYNVGTGNDNSFLEVAEILQSLVPTDAAIQFVEFPSKLASHYQFRTKSNNQKLLDTGCRIKFKAIREGITNFVNEVSTLEDLNLNLR